jgi:hypothetical protein
VLGGQHRKQTSAEWARKQSFAHDPIARLDLKATGEIDAEGWHAEGWRIRIATGSQPGACSLLAHGVEC